MERAVNRAWVRNRNENRDEEEDEKTGIGMGIGTRMKTKSGMQIVVGMGYRRGQSWGHGQE